MVSVQFRSYVDADLEEIVALSILAWEPVFASFKQVLGSRIYPLLYPDWRKRQAEVATSTCRDSHYKVLVAAIGGRAIGFVAYEIRGETGEIQLLAVHPEYQNGGIGTQLNELALEAMKAGGVRLAEVATGGDQGHAAARRAYEKAGFLALPLVRYYKDL